MFDSEVEKGEDLPISLNTAGEAIRDFHLFANLAPELQDMIWEWACYTSPNLITMSINASRVELTYSHPSAASVPSVLQATSRSRAISLKHYQKTTTEDFVRSSLMLPRAPSIPSIVPQPRQGSQSSSALLMAPVRTSQISKYELKVRNSISLAARLVRYRRRPLYINHHSDIFHLKLGGATTYHYPVFSLSDYTTKASQSEAVKESIRRSRLSELQEGYALPKLRFLPRNLPPMTAKVQHLCLDLTLPPISPEQYPSQFQSRICSATKDFCTAFVGKIIRKFPALQKLDLMVHRDIPHHPQDKLMLNHWRDMFLREDKDDISFGHAELGYIESEIRLWLMGHAVKSGKEVLEARIVGLVTRYFSRTNY